MRAACNSLAKRVPPRGGCVTPAPCLGFHLDFGDCRRGPPRTAAEILAATDYTHNCHQSVLQRSRPLAARGGKGPRRREAAASFHVRPPPPAGHGAGLRDDELGAESRAACAVHQTRQHGMAPGAPRWSFDDSRSGGCAGRAGES